MWNANKPYLPFNPKKDVESDESRAHDPELLVGDKGRGRGETGEGGGGGGEEEERGQFFALSLLLTPFLFSQVSLPTTWAECRHHHASLPENPLRRVRRFCARARSFPKGRTAI